MFVIPSDANADHTCSHRSDTFYDTTSLRVNRASEITHFFTVEKGDHVNIELQVSGGLDDDVGIRMKNSKGEVFNSGLVYNSINLENFKAKYSGQYRMEIDNSYSLVQGKTVGITTEITSYFPQHRMDYICDQERDERNEERQERHNQTLMSQVIALLIVIGICVAVGVVVVKFVIKPRKR